MPRECRFWPNLVNKDRDSDVVCDLASSSRYIQSTVHCVEISRWLIVVKANFLTILALPGGRSTEAQPTKIFGLTQHKTILMGEAGPPYMFCSHAIKFHCGTKSNNLPHHTSGPTLPSYTTRVIFHASRATFWRCSLAPPSPP